ncbi:MAG: hypothetical protein EOO51_05450 [Flavobacterium sp.]|nr:MAG: hypothetical protein EOO51_05450 [Flavobacterium sp.]
MRFLIPLVLLFNTAFSQIDTQNRFSSDSRQYYVWSDNSNSYLLQETEYEHSLIDIREIGSRSNGYIAISLTDNGRARLFHGSIVAFSTNEKKEPTWQMRSKNMKGKLTFNPDKNTFTFVYDANEKRYQRILIFTLKEDEESAKDSAKDN